MNGALPNQPLAFAMRAACVFFLDGLNTNDGADMPVGPVNLPFLMGSEAPFSS